MTSINTTSHHQYNKDYPIFFNGTATTEIYTLSLHDVFRSEAGLNIGADVRILRRDQHETVSEQVDRAEGCRSEEHTSELQSLRHLVCRLLLEKKKNIW